MSGLLITQFAQSTPPTPPHQVVQEEREEPKSSEENVEPAPRIIDALAVFSDQFLIRNMRKYPKSWLWMLSGGLIGIGTGAVAVWFGVFLASLVFAHVLSD